MNAIVFLILASCLACDNNEDMDDINVFACDEYESITRDSICQWYSGRTLIVDDPFDGMCFDLLTRVGRITFSQSNFNVGTGNIYGARTCNFVYDNADFETIKFEGDVFSDNRVLLSELNEKDIVRVKGQFSYSDKDFIVDHSLTLKPHDISQKFGSPFDECGLLGKAWFNTNGGLEYRITFLYWNNMHFMIDTRTNDYRLYNRPTSYFSYQGDCSSIEMEGIRTGEKTTFQIKKLTQDSLIIEREDSRIEKFYRTR